MAITSAVVKELREKTGVGMMECKKALEEANGDLEQAIENLRKKGVATAEKKATRTAADGLIGSFISTDAKTGVLVEVNCETDFVTKTEDFQKFVANVTNTVKEKDPKDVDGLMSLPLGGATVKDVQTTLVAKIGENLGVRRFVRLAVDSKKKLAQYIHAGSKIGVIVAYSDPNGKLDDATAREVAMHVAAMHPQYVRREDISQDVIEKEKEIMKAQMGDVKKPAEILEKIVSGKINKFFTEVCLDDQFYVRDPDGKSTVSGWLKKIDNNISIEKFIRFQVGEGIEKKVG